jgi:hypothetical protein
VGWLPGEIRLALTIGTSIFVLAAAARFVRRWVGLRSSAQASDALLIFFFVQYLSVGVPGIVGLLNAPVILALGCAIAALLWFAPLESVIERSEDELSRDRWTLSICTILVLSYLASLLWSQQTSPPLANDTLTYHFPAAIQWIQRGRIGLYEAWLYNPANTFSPLAGSVFMTWLMAPMHSDILARFVQMPALLLIFFGAIELMRGMGARLMVAALVATAIVLSRPLIGEAILAKDDLFVVAFFVAALAGLSREKLSDRFGPWRVGVALGLMLATKYTALLCVPMLLLAIDARPMRVRSWLIVIGAALLLAGPWFVRNLMLTGNPLYPIGSMLTTARSEHLASWPGIRKTLAGSYLAPPPWLWGVALVGWVAAIAKFRASVFREPLLRVCVLGPLVMIGIFLLKSPYDEVRFILPAIVLLMACAARGPCDLIVPILLLATSLATSFIPDALKELLPGVALAALAGIGGLLAWRKLPPSHSARSLAVIILVTAVGLIVYVQWTAFTITYRRQTNEMWRNPSTGYGELAEAWIYVRDELPAEQTLAYANTFYVYPLYGPDLDRRVAYAPLRAGLKHIRDLPRIAQPLTGEQIVPAAVRLTNADPDRQTWLENLRKLGANLVLIAKADLTNSPDSPPPAELTFAEQDPAHFQRVFDNSSAAIYRFTR